MNEMSIKVILITTENNFLWMFYLTNKLKN